MTKKIKNGFHFQTKLITIAARIVVIIMVVVTAIPYAAAKLPELLNASTTATTTINKNQLMVGI